MEGKNNDRYKLCDVMCWKKNDQINCTFKKIQNTIPNITLLVSDYCWNEYKKDIK